MAAGAVAKFENAFADWREEGNTWRADINGRKITIAVHSPEVISAVDCVCGGSFRHE